VSALPEQEQIAFVRRWATELQSALSYGLEPEAGPTAAEVTAAWLLNAQGEVHQSLAERAALERAAADPKLADLAQRLPAARRRLAALAYGRVPSGKGEDHGRRLALLARSEQELARKFALAAGTGERGDSWVGVDEVRAALPADGVLIGIARFERRRYLTKDP